MKMHVKSAVLGLALITLLTGLSACAKRPMVIGGSAPAPSPSAAVTPDPTR
jgi:starvation-inducible outer membrane lipoprotein